MRPHVPPRIGYGARVSDLHPAARERTAKQPFYRPGPCRSGPGCGDTGAGRADFGTYLA